MYLLGCCENLSEDKSNVQKLFLLLLLYSSIKKLFNFFPLIMKLIGIYYGKMQKGI